MTFLEAVGGRKVLVGLVLTAIAVTLDLTHGLSETMSTFLLSIGIGYFGSNVLVKGATALVSRGSGPDEEPGNNNKIEALSQQVNTALTQVQAVANRVSSLDAQTRQFAEELLRAVKQGQSN